jgi:hypothetical protein
MPREDTTIAQETDKRRGFNSAVDAFCSEASGETLKSGDSYLSMATEVWLNFGNKPSEYGLLGFVFCKSLYDSLRANCITEHRYV